MDLRQLRYFVAIVEQGSFSKAAAHLHAAQPALSQHIRHMEQELGVQLLHRGARGVQPTEAGERLLKHASIILAQFAQIRDSVREGERLPSGEVKIGMPGTVGEQLGVPLIEAARARYPGVRIRLAEAMSGFVLDWLRRHQIDLAMIYSIADPRGLEIHHALTEELCLFARPDLAVLKAPPESAVPLAEALSLDLILPSPSHGLRVLIEGAASATKARVEPVIEIDSYNQIKGLAQRGLGYSILPRTAVQKEIAAGRLAAWRLVDPPLARKVYLAYSTERPLGTAARAVGQLGWEILHELVRSGAWTATLAGTAERLKLYPAEKKR